MNNSKKIELSICTIKNIVHISINPFILSKLSSILKCNDKGELHSIQIADEDFFQKIKPVAIELRKKYPHTFKLMQFLESIPTNEKFTIVHGNVIRDPSINNYVDINKKIYELNNMQYPLIVGKMGDLYNVYFWGDNRIHVGEPDKEKRVCRFCGENSSKVTFKNNAHAISESLGNKILFCNEECDTCNEKFSEIEQDFFNVHSLLYSLYEIKGKNGIPNISGKNIKIDNKNKKVIQINDKTGSITIENIFSQKFEMSEKCLKYTCQNLYKCLCKFAISLIDKKHLERLSRTIHWICSDNFVTELPTIWSRTCHIINQPTMAIYVKKNTTDKELPDFIVKLFIINIEYLFVLPFVDLKIIDFSEIERRKLKEIFDLSEYDEMDLSSDEIRNMQISFDIKMQDGTEIITINKSEFDILSENERTQKYPKASGFHIIDIIN